MEDIMNLIILSIFVSICLQSCIFVYKFCFSTLFLKTHAYDNRNFAPISILKFGTCKLCLFRKKNTCETMMIMIMIMMKYFCGLADLYLRIFSSNFQFHYTFLKVFRKNKGLFAQHFDSKNMACCTQNFMEDIMSLILLSVVVSICLQSCIFVYKYCFLLYF